MVGSQITTGEHKRFPCEIYIISFPREDKLKDYLYDSILQLKNYSYSFIVVVAIYADFECMLQIKHSCKPNNTNAYQKHIPIRFT